MMKKYITKTCILISIISIWINVRYYIDTPNTQEQKDYAAIHFCEARWYHWREKLSWEQKPTNSPWVTSSKPYITCDWENPIGSGTIDIEALRHQIWKRCKSRFDVMKPHIEGEPEYWMFDFDCSDLMMEALES